MLVGRLTRDPEFRTLPSGKHVTTFSGLNYTNVMTTSTHPAAYLRRSYVDPDSPGDISREAQRATVRKLATADGHNGNLVEYDDWGVSADVAKAAKRTAYARLLADMEAGEVSAVYAFDVDRLYRDPRDLIRLQDAAARHRVRIVTTAGELAIGDGDDPSAEAFAFIGSVFGRMELQKAKKRNRATIAARRIRGDDFGHAPYGYRRERQDDGRSVFVRDPAEPIEPVIDAFLEAGSFGGAAKILNARGIPTNRGGPWAGNVVNRIVRRERPGLAPRGRGERRVAPRGSHLFSRVLRCHCGQLLTPRVTRHNTRYGSYGPYVSYQCHRGRYDAVHHRPYMVSEASILSWAKAEAARLRVPHAGERVGTGAEDASERRRAAIARRERAAALFLEGDIDREAFEAEKARAILELDQLDEAETGTPIPSAIDWDAPPATVNAVLRAMWRHVELDAAMQPVQAEWIRPEWRRP
jgi:DNA invertase Pin-like site-specific DNA recombinase